MAHHVEPMDIDSDFDNKENSLHHNNVLPFTEKGYEELDVSELNMKLRYSVTPVSSPMSKSYTANCVDNRSLESGDDSLNVTVSENSNLTRSLNSTITRNDSVVKSLKALPLQAIPTEQFVDSNRNTSVLRALDTTITPENGNVTVTVSVPSDIDENLSLPSSSSSTLHTPEATTPTKDISPKDGGSPIMRGLKSVLSMFRTSQSPIPPVDNDNAIKPEILSPVESQASMQDIKPQTVLASTPIAAHRKKEMSPTKRSSPQKDLSIVFNDDLEKELQWKDETTIIFSQERIPIHKLMLRQPLDGKTFNKDVTADSVPDNRDLNSTVEYMDISYNDSIKDRTVTDIQLDNKPSEGTFAGESDSEFVDCETTFTKNDSNVIEDKDTTPMADKTQEFNLTKEIEESNDSGSRLKPIILDTTQDILDATLSVRPEDLLPDILDEINSKSEISKESNEFDHQIMNQTVNVTEGVALEPSLDLNITMTLDVLSTTHTTDRSFDVMSCDITNAEVQKDNLNITKTKDNILSETHIDQPKDTENLNTTITNETITLDNKTFDAESTPTEDNNKVEELNKTESINCTNSDPIAPVFTPLSLEEIANKLLSFNDTNVDIVNESSITELPVDVPLPDEDDLDKESNWPTDITVESTTPSVALPLDLVDDIKTNTEITNIMNTVPKEERKMLTEDIEKADIDNLNANPIPESGDNINNQTFELIPNAIVKALNETVETTNCIKEISDVGILPKNTLLNTVLDNDNESTVDTKPENTELTQTKLEMKMKKKNEDANNMIQNIGEHKDIEVPMDINESLGEFKPLPDIINQTISYIENLESTGEVHEAIKEVVKTTQDSIKTKVGSETININEKSTAEVHEAIKEVVETTQDSIKTKVGSETININEKSTAEVHEAVKEVVETTQDSIKTKVGSETININEKLTAEVHEAIKAIVEKTEDSIKTEVASEAININEQSTAEVHEVIGEKVKKTENSIKSEIEPKAININEPQIATQPLVETNKVVEELITNKYFTLESDTNMIENQLNEVTNASITENEIPITKDSDPSNKNVITVVEKVNKDEEVIEKVTEITNTKAVEEEIIVSENNSPFVSVIADNIPEIKHEENTDNETVTDTVDTTTKVVFTPPSSPPISSKGYNFNFDDLDYDPFATKTNIRLSPPLDSQNKHMETNIQTEPKSFEKRVLKKDNNRRKSQPERKRASAPKRKFNSTFDGTINNKLVEPPNRKPENVQKELIELHPPNSVALSPSNVSIEEKTQSETIEIQPETVVDSKENLNPASEILLEGTIDQSKDILAEASESSINMKLKEVISSSEQSTYYSASTSSSETSIQSRNVFNLPEIDDMNFNPFATKSKMRQSPPPDLDIDNPFITKSKVKCSPDSSMIIPQENKNKTTLLEDKIENEPMEKEVLSNLSNTTTSDKATDENHTTISDSDQIRTEDEDTVEGPFLEAEDLNTDDKMSDFDGENIDMMQFNELPKQSNEENVDNGEMFIDAEAFEFLLNQNQSNIVVDSGKESLFLKFDPLFAKRMSAVTSDGVVASLARLQRKQSTPTKAAPTPPKNMPSPIAGPSNLNVTQDIDMNNSEELNDDLNITVSKPMMVVPPAVNPVTPRNKSLTPNRSNRHSITFTSPAMAVIDRLLSLSSNNSMVHDTTVTHVSREQNEADIALSQLRELLAEKEISVYQLRSESRELRDRLSTLESNVKSLENVCEDRLKKINQLNETLAEKTKINRSMAAVVEEYERTIASLIAETAQDKKRHAEERIKLINERDEQTAHLTSMEVSFSDLHSKYEKSKQVILNCKANEDAYKKSIKDFEENFTKMQNNYELLKQHATSKLNHANQEMEKINRTHEAEVLKLNAMIKRKELHITSLEESFNQKTKANEELTAICDELINKVG